MEEFAGRLKQSRLNKGFTLEELAARYNQKFSGERMGKSHLSKLENGKQQPGVFTVKNLCIVLGVSMDWITGLKD